MSQSVKNQVEKTAGQYNVKIVSSEGGKNVHVWFQSEDHTVITEQLRPLFIGSKGFT